MKYRLINSVKPGYILLLLLPLLVYSCLEFVAVRQPATAQIGEVITIEIDAKITGKDGSILVFGFLAPRAWRAAENTTVSFESMAGGSTMSLMPEDEVDATNMLPWGPQITDRVGIGKNYGEVEWVVFKADNEVTPPNNTSEENPLTGTITVVTKVGNSNMIAQLGYFMGDALWGYNVENTNSEFFFVEECIEVKGASGQAQNLCGPPPRRLVTLETYTFEDILPIVFDAQEDATALIGAEKIYYCSTAIYESGTSEVCEISSKTEMKRIGNDLWRLTIWPPSFYDIPQGSIITEITASFRDETGNVIVQDISGNDFQILAKCF